MPFLLAEILNFQCALHLKGVGSLNTLTVTVKRLRSKLKDYGKYIKTVRGIGYIWEDSSDEGK